jgi:hypothetical protein
MSSYKVLCVKLVQQLVLCYVVCLRINNNLLFSNGFSVFAKNILPNILDIKIFQRFEFVVKYVVHSSPLPFGDRVSFNFW